MKRDQYMGMDVHQATTVVAVLDGEGKVILEATVATEASAIIRLLQSLSGPMHVTFEETTQSAWLYEVVRCFVAKVIVCDPRRNKLLSEGSKADRTDARRLAELLRAGMLRGVYHGHDATRKLQQLVRGYETLSGDLQRVMVRIKAIYRSCGIATTGRAVYQPQQREHWLMKLAEEGRRQRVEWLYDQLDHLRPLRKQAKQAMIAESQKHHAIALLKTIPQLGPVRAALLVATLDTPHRFRTRHQLWSYSGLGVVTHMSAEYEIKDGRATRRRKPIATRGLNRNCNHRMKEVFIGAATGGSHIEPYRSYLEGLKKRGIRKEMARLTLARKIAAVALTLWKKGETFDPKKLNWLT
ncbi:MAG TPA: transposase [Terriglobia bacterium]|nr:transposase [Terriglobia bacterium]